MNKSHITAILAITSLSFNTGAMVQSMPKDEYKAAGKTAKPNTKLPKQMVAHSAMTPMSFA